jgi:hypothetical protein
MESNKRKKAEGKGIPRATPIETPIGRRVPLIIPPPPGVPPPPNQLPRAVAVVVGNLAEVIPQTPQELEAERLSINLTNRIRRAMGRGVKPEILEKIKDIPPEVNEIPKVPKKNPDYRIPEVPKLKAPIKPIKKTPKGKGLNVGYSTENANGLAHIYPISHEAVLQMLSCCPSTKNI